MILRTVVRVDAVDGEGCERSDGDALQADRQAPSASFVSVV